MLTFPGAPPDIDCTWVHYSFSTTFGSRRVRTSVCVSLVVDDTTCTRVPFLCVPFVQIRLYVFSLFRRICLPLSHPSLSSVFLLLRLPFYLYGHPSFSSFTSDSYRLACAFPAFFFYFTYPPLLIPLSLSFSRLSVHPSLVGYFRLPFSFSFATLPLPPPPSLSLFLLFVFDANLYAQTEASKRIARWDGGRQGQAATERQVRWRDRRGGGISATDRGHRVREEKRETEIGRASGRKKEKRVIRERKMRLPPQAVAHDAQGQGRLGLGDRAIILYGDRPSASCTNGSLQARSPLFTSDAHDALPWGRLQPISGRVSVARGRRLTPRLPYLMQVVEGRHPMYPPCLLTFVPYLLPGSKVTKVICRALQNSHSLSLPSCFLYRWLLCRSTNQSIFPGSRYNLPGCRTFFKISAISQGQPVRNYFRGSSMGRTTTVVTKLSWPILFISFY